MRVQKVRAAFRTQAGHLSRHRSKLVLPIVPPDIARFTFCSNSFRFERSTSAASLFSGSSGFGS